MESKKINPIAWVDNQAVPCPSSYEWGLDDLSDSDSGRTQDTVMDKQKLGQVVKIKFTWQNVTTETASIILKAFNPEYINVRYLDPMENGFRTAEFYVGNRTAPLYNSTLGVWKSISFNIIERDGRRDV